MGFGITPRAGAAPEGEFPVPNVTVLNFTGTGFTCTRGTGEQSNVVTIEINRAAPTWGFLDNFNGPADANISTHTPDIAPAGFAWTSTGVGGQEVELVGNGTVAGVRNGSPVSGLATSQTSSPAFSLPFGPLTKTFTFNANPTADNDPFESYFIQSWYMEFVDGTTVYLLAGYGTFVRRYFAYTNGTTGASFTSLQDVAWGVATDLEMEMKIGPAGVTATVNGVAAPVTASNPGSGWSIASTMNFMSITSDQDTPGTPYIDRIRITEGPP